MPWMMSCQFSLIQYNMVYKVDIEKGMLGLILPKLRQKVDSIQLDLRSEGEGE